MPKCPAGAVVNVDVPSMNFMQGASKLLRKVNSAAHSVEARKRQRSELFKVSAAQKGEASVT